MQPTQTGIATALALVVVVVVVFFLAPGLWPFRVASTTSPADHPAAVDTSVNAQVQNGLSSTTNPTNTTTTMPPSQTVNATELSAKDLVVGTGDTAVAGDIVTVNYVGSLTNGTVFDASANHGTTGFTFPLGAGQVIKGWDEGVAGMKVGGKRVLVIPPSLGYGNQAVGSAIPANSTLLFEVELLKVQKGGK
jgi:FKBP-type peptidyl-prolyl cis-trans isomerase